MSLSFDGSWMGNIGFNLSLNRQNLKIAQDLISELEERYL
jgi:hypothetical protein